MQDWNELEIFFFTHGRRCSTPGHGHECSSWLHSCVRQ